VESRISCGTGKEEENRGFGNWPDMEEMDAVEETSKPDGKEVGAERPVWLR
jgi:hypothetical protein